jgi:hypothetical protein
VPWFIITVTNRERRGARLARREAFIISRYMTDDQRSQTGWIGVPKWEVILGWALRLPKPFAFGIDPEMRTRTINN